MKLIGANWQTTLSAIGTAMAAALTFLSGISYDLGPISMIIPIEYKPLIVKVAGIATLILWIWNGIAQKSKNVTGGTVQQTVSGAVAEEGTRSMVDQTVKASIESGEAVTREQRIAVTS